jgi:hypothetical protein
MRANFEYPIKTQIFYSDVDTSSDWSLPIDNYQLQQYLASLGGQRKKREAAAAQPVYNNAEGRFFNFTGNGFGTISYSWREVISQYLQLGTAAALLFTLAAHADAPSEPSIPFDLPTFPTQSYVDKSDYNVYRQTYQGELDSFSSPQKTPKERFFEEQEQRPKKPYFEDLEQDQKPKKQFFEDLKEHKPFIRDIVKDNVDDFGSEQVLKKRVDLFPGLFRKFKNGKRQKKIRKRRPRPGVSPVALQAPPKREAIPERPQESPASPAFDGFGSHGQDLGQGFSMTRAESVGKTSPFLSDDKFNDFFPSWSRDKRSTDVVESKFFNISGSGWGTISYPWTDVIDTYAKYALALGLMVGMAGLLSAPGQQIIPFDLPSIKPFDLPRINPGGQILPPNLPEG